MRYDVSKVLTKYRDAHHMRSKDMAEVCGKGHQYMGEIISGLRKPGIKCAREIAHRLHIPLETLIGCPAPEQKKNKAYPDAVQALPPEKQVGRERLLEILASDGNGDYLSDPTPIHMSCHSEPDGSRRGNRGMSEGFAGHNNAW